MSSWIANRKITTARNWFWHSVHFGKAGIAAITVTGTVVPSVCLAVRQDRFISFTVMSELFAYGGHSGIHLHVTNWICADSKRTCKESVLRLQLKAIRCHIYINWPSVMTDWMTNALNNQAHRTQCLRLHSILKTQNLKELKKSCWDLLFFCFVTIYCATYNKSNNFQKELFVFRWSGRIIVRILGFKMLTFP
jgi:hypothetical protein